MAGTPFRKLPPLCRALAGRRHPGRLNRNDVEDIGLISLAALLAIVAVDVLKVAVWIIWELLRLVWRGIRWCWRRERAHQAAKPTAAIGVALIALALAVALAPAQASVDPAGLCHGGGRRRSRR